MAALGSQSIASSFEQLLHVDADGGGNGTTHVSVKDGDNGTTFGFTIASDALMMTGTNRLEFGDTGTYIHQSADGVLDLVSDTEIEINATTIDMNGAVDISGNTIISGGDEQAFTVRTADPGRVGIAIQNSDTGSATNFSDGLIIKLDSDETGQIGMAEDKAFNIMTNGNNRMTINESGVITLPAQPAFHAKGATDQSNIAISADVTIIFGTEIFDLGSNFASNTFTAPVTGKYQFNANISLDAVDTGADNIRMKFVTSNREVTAQLIDPDVFDSDGRFALNGSILVDMDANDTCTVAIRQNGGAQQMDIDSVSNFSGFLVA